VLKLRTSRSDFPFGFDSVSPEGIMAITERVGVIGVGRMGANIARRLKDVGYTVSAVYDTRPDVAQALGAEIGAETVTTLSRAVERSAGSAARSRPMPPMRC